VCEYKTGDVLHQTVCHIFSVIFIYTKIQFMWAQKRGMHSHY